MKVGVVVQSGGAVLYAGGGCCPGESCSLATNGRRAVGRAVAHQRTTALTKCALLHPARRLLPLLPWQIKLIGDRYRISVYGE